MKAEEAGQSSKGTSAVFAPRIEIFNPFEGDRPAGPVVSASAIEYMQGDNTKAVAKCTPCQCCACR